MHWASFSPLFRPKRGRGVRTEEEEAFKCASVSMKIIKRFAVKTFLEINIVVAVIMVSYFLLIIKIRVLKSRFRLRLLFFHDECFSEFRNLIADSDDFGR